MSEPTKTELALAFLELVISPMGLLVIMTVGLLWVLA